MNGARIDMALQSNPHFQVLSQPFHIVRSGAAHKSTRFVTKIIAYFE
jgi:hypothetical protein